MQWPTGPSHCGLPTDIRIKYLLIRVGLGYNVNRTDQLRVRESRRAGRGRPAPASSSHPGRRPRSTSLYHSPPHPFPGGNLVLGWQDGRVLW